MAVLPLPVYYNVNCFAVNEFGPLRRLTGALKVCLAAVLCWLFKIQAASFFNSWFLAFSYGFVYQTPPWLSTRLKWPSSQALESLVASPPRRRRTAAHSSQSSGNDSKPAPQSSGFLSGPSLPAAEPAIPVTGPAFPPTLFDQLVQRVAAEVTRQLQPDLFSPAVQAPQVPSPAPAATPLDIIKWSWMNMNNHQRAPKWRTTHLHSIRGEQRRRWGFWRAVHPSRGLLHLGETHHW